MKRLIAELYKGEKFYHEYIEIFKNPTTKEFYDVIKNSPFSDNNVVRGMLLLDGTLYIWDAEISHDRMIGSKSGVPEGIHLSISRDQIFIYLTPEHNPFNLRDAFIKTTTLYNFISKDTGVEYINCSTYGADKYNVYDKIEYVRDILNIKDEENLKVAQKFSRLIKSEFYDSRDPGGDFIEIFKNPNSVEVDKIRNSNAYKSLNGLITPQNDIYIWRGDLLPEQLNIGSINISSGIQFSFFPNWFFNAQSQLDFLAIYNTLKMKKALLMVIGDMTRPITITKTTDTDHIGDYTFDNWTAMDDYYTKNYTEIIE